MAAVSTIKNCNMATKNGYVSYPTPLKKRFDLGYTSVSY